MIFRKEYSDTRVFQKQAEYFRFTIFFEFVFFLISTFIFSISRNVLMLFENVETLAVIIHSCVLYKIAKKLGDEDGDNYNLSTDRVDVMVAFLSEILEGLLFCYLIVITSLEFFHKENESTHLLLVFGFVSAKILCNYVVLTMARNAEKIRKTAINGAVYAERKTSFRCSVVVLLFLVIQNFILHYDWLGYVSPALTIVLSLEFIIHISRKVRVYYSELTDKSISVEDQDFITDIVLVHMEKIVKINNIICHNLNHSLYIYLDIAFKEELSVADVNGFMDSVTEKIHESFPGAHVSLIVGGTR